jgi:hypothetical protein
MKLFLATNEYTSNTTLINLLKVAVKSAIENTNFEVYVIFDGDKSKLNLPSQVKVIEHRHRCFNIFKNSKRCSNNDFLISTASSTFLRTEIPFLMKKMGIEDEYCLYTDYDVIFNKIDFEEFDSIKPEIFAAAPEQNQNNWSQFNCGVMMMNINYLFENDNFILNHIENNFESLRVWDQTLYQNLYSNKVTKLDLVYNWKPYWGINNNAKIIHFHGVKPFKSTPFDEVLKYPTLKNMLEKNKESYEHYNNLFDSYL